MNAAKPETAKPRTKPAEVRREELMAAAEELFLEKGYDETSVDEIVKLAGVAKGTFYLHFRSKDDVLIGLRERFINLFYERLKRSADLLQPDDWAGRLSAWVAAAIHTYLDHYALHDLVFHENRPAFRFIKGANVAVSHLRALLIAGKDAENWVIDDDSYLTALMLFHALHGAVDEAIISPETIDRERLIHQVNSFFKRAISRGGNSG